MNKSLLTELDLNELEDRVEFGICSLFAGGQQDTASHDTNIIGEGCPKDIGIVCLAD